ncbi:transporter [Streptomyces sp. NPDC048172]|uniref:transporter n=1 Tax=Streptomyces sp. NPDC048172 TaxID=3365505 RepID=UPI003721B924
MTAGPFTAVETAPVTRVFVRLKWSLLSNGLRQSPGRRAAFLTSAVLALLLALLQVLGLLLMRGHEHAVTVAVVLSGLLALGWAVVPLFFPGGDETLDATRLVMLPLRPQRLVVALLAASLVGIGPVFTVLLAAGAVAAPAEGAAGWAVAAVALPLLVLSCVALARGVATANVRLLTSRRGRDLVLLSGLFIAIGAQFVNVGVQKVSEPGGLALLEPVGAVLGWLPPTSAVYAVRDASEGAYAVAAVRLLLAGGALAGLLAWWRQSLTRLMTTPDASTLQAATTAPEPSPETAATGRTRGVLGLLARLPGDDPGGRTAAVVQRTLRYAWRDPKTKVGWVSSLGIGLLLPVVLSVQGTGSPYNACWAAGVLGLQMYNQFGQDYSGFWLVASTISTRRDAHLELRGRMLAIALVAVPYVGVVVLLSSLLMDDWAVVPEVLGLASAVLGALLGTGALASVWFPYSIPQDSGYKNVAPGQGSLAYISFLGGMFAAAVLCAPFVAVTVWLHAAGGSAAGAGAWLMLPVGVAYGLLLAVLALRLAATRALARLPEILTAVSKG